MPWPTMAEPSPPSLPSAFELADSGAPDTTYLSPVAVALSAAVLLINGIVSLRFKLGLHTQLVVASVRMVVQLSLLGYVLVPIFTYDRWWLVMSYIAFMLCVASLEAVQRPSHSFQGMLANTLLAMAASSGALLTYLVLLVLQLRRPEAQYVIPLAGMLLGNATSAVSVGLSCVLEELATNRPVIEHLLALGANRFEATDAAVRRALKMSMTPLLNQMSVMGVVSIPGMMTGQILAGGDPAQAARYQMVIMFDRLIKKQVRAGGPAADVAAWLAAVRRGAATVRRKTAALGSCLAAACCCCLCPPPSSRRRDNGNGADYVRLLPQHTASSAAAAVGRTTAATVGSSSPFLPAIAITGGGGGNQHYRTAGRWPAGVGKWVWPAGARRHGCSQMRERMFSADSATSSLLTAGGPVDGGGGGGGGVTSPMSANSLVSPPGTSYFWDERMTDEGEEGPANGGDAAGGGGRAGSIGEQPGLGLPLLGASPSAAAAAGAYGNVGNGAASGVLVSGQSGSGMVGSTVAAVVAARGWLGSLAVAGCGAAWTAVGRWRSGGTAGVKGSGSPGVQAASYQALGSPRVGDQAL